MIWSRSSLCNPILKGILWGRKARFWLCRHTQQMQNGHIKLTDKNQDVTHSPHITTYNRFQVGKAQCALTDWLNTSSHRKPSMRSRARARPRLPSEGEEQQRGRYTRLAGSSFEHGAWTTANLELQQNWITLDTGFREPAPGTPQPCPESDTGYFLWTPEPCSGVWQEPLFIFSTALPWMMQGHGTQGVPPQTLLHTCHPLLVLNSP